MNSYKSYHPGQHKWANFHYLFNKLNKIPLSKNNYNKELNNIINISQYNKFPINKIHKFNNKIKKTIFLDPELRQPYL